MHCRQQQTIMTEFTHRRKPSGDMGFPVNVYSFSSASRGIWRSVLNFNVIFCVGMILCLYILISSSRGKQQPSVIETGDELYYGKSSLKVGLQTSLLWQIQFEGMITNQFIMANPV